MCILPMVPTTAAWYAGSGGGGHGGGLRTARRDALGGLAPHAAIASQGASATSARAAARGSCGHQSEETRVISRPQRSEPAFFARSSVSPSRNMFAAAVSLPMSEVADAEHLVVLGLVVLRDEIGERRDGRAMRVDELLALRSRALREDEELQRLTLISGRFSVKSGRSKSAL